jgi:hypothetical protein
VVSNRQSGGTLAGLRINVLGELTPNFEAGLKHFRDPCQ